MSPTRLPSRKRRASEVAMAEEDALISMPMDILNEILTRLDLRDLVRTSVLSRNWRHRWKAVPSLDLYFPGIKGDKSGPKGLRSVDGILLRYPGRVRRFYARRIDKIYEGRIHDWLLVLSQRGVQTLDLGPNFIDNKLSLPSHIFSCGRLISITLCNCAIPPLPPGFEGFTELRTLVLFDVQLQQNGAYQLEEIIATSPSLEALTLWYVDIQGEFTEWLIQAPNLRHLKIVSAKDFGWNIEELPYLDSIFINIWNYVGDRNLSKFLSSCANIANLGIYTRHLQINGVVKTLPCIFRNLKKIDMQAQFCELHSILSTFNLLRNAPNLEILRIVLDGDVEQKFEANVEFQSAQCTDGTCANLQYVKTFGIHWLPNEMSFIELILSKARHLHTISIMHATECIMPNEDALKNLLNYKKASTQAEVLFKGKLKYERDG